MNDAIREQGKIFDEMAKLASDRLDEIEQLKNVLQRAATAWCGLEPGVAWEGDLGDAMIAAVAEIEKLRAGWEDETEPVSDIPDVSKRVRPNDDPAAALYVFMGWLTRREEVSGPFSGSEGSSQAGVLLKQFCDWNKLREPDMSTTVYTHPE